MCVAYPGTVLSVKDRSAMVDFSGTKVEALTGLTTVKPGDRVLVHAGCVMQVLPEEEADEIKKLFDEIRAMSLEDMKKTAEG